ncbi:LysR family transcriptional regulator [Variovorax sp. VNK109]|uniref:LysR family transcriptional regulator n=1 Tax=Variovorax sp. VNK109 TaxID=3400919 RepID=UPI003BFE689A
MDTLELMRTFREVAQRGSFSQAARALDVSKANVSKYVAELETKLGVRLLNRSTRTVSLTDAGALLLERSTPLMEMIDVTRAELQQRALQPSGRVKLTATYAMGNAELPPLLADFMREHPKVSVSLHLSNRVVDLVEQGVDIALRVGRLNDSSLIARKLKRMQFVVCATPAFWAEHGEPTHPEQLSEFDALTYSLTGHNPEWHFADAQGQPIAVQVHTRAEANDGGPLAQLALHDLGMAYLPRALVEDEIQAGRLKPVLEEFMPRDMWLYAAYMQRRHNSAALRALLSWLEARWKED